MDQGQQGSETHFRFEVTRRVTLASGAEVLFHSRHPMKPERQRFLREADLRIALRLLAGFVMAALLPPRHLARWCHVVAGLRLRKHLRKEYPAFAESVTAVLGPYPDDKLRRIFRASQDARQRRLVELCSELVGSSRPRIDLIGADGLRRALERGRGAIVWCSQFTPQNLVGKRALHEGGFECHQVSVAEHGFSNSVGARRLLNPLTVRAENRYLKERVVFDRSDAIGVTRRISGILKRNGVVLMTNNIYSGSSFAETPFGVCGHQQWATTPVNFAVRAGAALFVMSTHEVEPFERYEAVVWPELEVPAPKVGASGSSWSIAQALVQAGDYLLADIRRSPEQFMAWGAQGQSVAEAYGYAADQDPRKGKLPSR